VTHPTPDEKVVIAYLHPGHVDGNFCASLAELVLWDQRNAAHLLAVDGLACGPYIHQGRNELVHNFLVSRQEADWLLFLDYDMTFSRDLLDRLLATADPIEFPVVGGLYYSGFKDGPVFVEAFVESDAEGAEDGLMAIAAVESDRLLEVAAAGAGCLLIHRSVRGEMLLRWSEDKHWWFPADGEDKAFCGRVRELGYRIVVDTSIVLGHCKRSVITESDYRRYLARVTDDGDREGVVAQHYSNIKWADGKPTNLAFGTR
jgi:hypothetical protein